MQIDLDNAQLKENKLGKAQTPNNKNEHGNQWILDSVLYALNSDGPQISL